MRVHSHPLIFTLLFLTAAAICFNGCHDIFEKNLEKETVTLSSPADQIHTVVLSHAFRWEEVEDADLYNLQIVTPSFSNTELFVLDTNVSSTEFFYTLYPDTFQWRVSAYNSSSYTSYSTRTLYIDTTSNLTYQKVTLISPANQLATRNTFIIFSWNEISIADDYRFEIRKTDWNGTLVKNPQIVTGDSITETLPEGFYSWGVQAQNTISMSLFSVRSLIVDTTRPNIPVLTYPVNNDTVPDSELTNSTLQFQWKRGKNIGSVINDSLFIFKDSVYLVKKTSVSDTVYNYQLQTKGTYFWYLYSLDAAGNRSDTSAIRKFIYEK